MIKIHISNSEGTINNRIFIFSGIDILTHWKQTVFTCLTFSLKKCCYPSLSPAACAVLSPLSTQQGALCVYVCLLSKCMCSCVFSPWKVFPHSRDPTSLWQRGEDRRRRIRRRRRRRRRRRSITLPRVWLSAVTTEEEQRARSFLRWTWGGLAL